MQESLIISARKWWSMFPLCTYSSIRITDYQKWVSSFKRGRGEVVLWSSTCQVPSVWRALCTLQKNTSDSSWLWTLDMRILGAAGLFFLQIAGIKHQDDQWGLLISPCNPPYSCFLLFGSWTLPSHYHLKCFPFLPFLILLSCLCSYWLASCCMHITCLFSLSHPVIFYVSS